MDTKFPEGQQSGLEGSKASMIQLDSTLWLDLDGATLIRNQEEILLTAREVDVLRILVHTARNTRSYIDASAIAERIIKKDTISDPEHCIEETIRSIRRKFNEMPRHPQILQGRYGFGYRLFLMQI